MLKENLIRPAIPICQPSASIAEKGRASIVQSRKLRVAVVAATMLLPAACGGTTEATPDATHITIPDHKTVRLELIDDSLCATEAPGGGVTAKTLNALKFALAGVMQAPRAGEWTHEPRHGRRPHAATKPTAPPNSPKPSATTNAPVPSPTIITPRPSYTTAPPVTVRPSPSKIQVTPSLLPTPDSRVSPSRVKQTKSITGMLPPVSATALPVPTITESRALPEHCDVTTVQIEVCPSLTPPLNSDPNATDPGCKAYLVDYDEFIGAKSALDSMNTGELITLTQDLDVIGELR